MHYGIQNSAQNTEPNATHPKEKENFNLDAQRKSAVSRMTKIAKLTLKRELMPYKNIKEKIPIQGVVWTFNGWPPEVDIKPPALMVSWELKKLSAAKIKLVQRRIFYLFQ